MSTVTITAADVNKLRQQTGAGMMDCKKALLEANGDFEAAIDNLRKKGQKVAANRSDKEANEGIVIAGSTADGKHAAMIMISCETDFVAKNADFMGEANALLQLAIDNKPANLDELKAMKIGNGTVSEKLFDLIGKIGEKIDLNAYEHISAEKVIAYNHPGNKLAAMVGFNGSPEGIEEVGKNVAMQIAAMAPVAIDKEGVDSKMIEREIEIGMDQARQEGKPEAMLEKIAQGKLQKFYNENTLLNQSFIKDEKKTIRQYLEGTSKGLTATAFKRIRIGA